MVKGRPKIKINIIEMISLYQNGINCEILAHRYGVSARTIFRRLKENGISRPWIKFPNLTPERVAMEYTQTNATQRGIAEKYGTSARLIRFKLRAAGVPPFFKDTRRKS